MPRSRRGRGEGSLFQRADGVWVGSASFGYGPDGRRSRVTVYGDTKKEAQLKLAAELAKGGRDPAERLTLGDFLDRWLSSVAKLKLSPKSYARYDQRVRLQIKPHLGRLQLAKLTQLHVEGWFAALAAAGASPVKQQKAGSLLRSVLRHACRLRLIGHNVAGDVPLPRACAREMTPLDVGQVERLLAAAGPWEPLLRLAVDSGMRQGELFGLQWPDLDAARSCVFVQRSLEELNGRLRLKELKTKKSRRRIDLAASTVKSLAGHQARQAGAGLDAKGGPVFANLHGGLLRNCNFLKVVWQPLLAQAELPAVRFHDLRHTCATLLLLAGVNPKIVSERLGHARVEITLNTYSHVLPTMQAGAAQVMEKLLG